MSLVVGTTAAIKDRRNPGDELRLTLPPILALPGPADGFPKSAAAVWDKKRNAFYLRFTPSLNFLPCSTVNSFWYIAAKRLFVKHAPLSSDVLEEVIAYPICILCDHLESRVIGAANERRVLDIAILQPSRLDILSSLLYIPPENSVGSNSVLYVGPSRLDSLTFRLERVPQLRQTGFAHQHPFPVDAIEEGLLELTFAASCASYGRYY